MFAVAFGHISFVRSTALGLAAGAALMMGSGSLQAQTVDQTLDSIVTFGQTRVQGVVQTPELKTIYFTSDTSGNASTPITGTNFITCQGTGTRGLYCLDGTGSGAKVKRYPNPDKYTEYTTEVTCGDLGMVNCTAMTVGLAGQIWVAGQKVAGGTYSLVKAVQTVGDTQTCLAASAGGTWTNTPSGTYCYNEYASGRSKIYEISMIDGDAGAYFQGYGPGVLSLEEPGTANPAGPLTVAYYQDTLPAQAPIVLINKWSNVTSGSESLQSVTLLQLRYTNPVSNFILASTSTGKVLGYLLPWSGNSKPFDTGFRYASLATSTGPACTPAAPYELKTSARTRRTYFTAGDCIAGYDPAVSGPANKRTVSFPTQSFALTADYSLSGVAVSPGIEIDFVRDGCTILTPGGCTLLKDGGDTNTYDAARLANIQLSNYNLSGWVLYQVTGIPDCRWISPRPAICVTSPLGNVETSTVLNADGSVAPEGTGDPSKQYLNITPLLPPEIKQAFADGALPPMLLQPDYRARKTIASGRSDYTFDALFGIPEQGLGYRETFDGQFDIEDLIGSKLGCGGGQLQASSLTPPPWDPVVNISEIAPTVGGWGVNYATTPVSRGTPNWVSALLNDGCVNPTSLAGTRGSAFLYGLEVSPKFQVKTGNTMQWAYPDSAFALLMRSLARDFNAHLYTYACTNLDAPAGSNPPLDGSTCYQLQKDWPNVYDKLTKCINATDQPKTSAGSQNCGSFETQFEAFKPEVMNAMLYGPDPNNRVGEIKSRLMVLSYVYYSQFKPSIKDRGFTNPNQ